MDLDSILDAAPVIEFPDRGALVFPHTRLTTAGHLAASVARAAARSRREVLALGVLHGAREQDAPLVAKARAGDADARKQLRGVHREEGIAAEEFSLDGFRALYERSCEREGIRPRLTARYPFLVGDHPEDLPGWPEVAQLARTHLVVGTADPMHHGIGYRTAEALDETLAGTLAFARGRIEEQIDALARADFSGFSRLCSRDASDFRDVGPVLAMLFPGAAWTVNDMSLVNYADVLECAKPTWVAAALISSRASRAT